MKQQQERITVITSYKIAEISRTPWEQRETQNGGVTLSPRWCPPQRNTGRETKGRWWQLPPCLVRPYLSGCSSSISKCG